MPAPRPHAAEGSRAGRTHSWPHAQPEEPAQGEPLLRGRPDACLLQKLRLMKSTSNWDLQRWEHAARGLGTTAGSVQLAARGSLHLACRTWAPPAFVQPLNPSNAGAAALPPSGRSSIHAAGLVSNSRANQSARIHSPQALDAVHVVLRQQRQPKVGSEVLVLQTAALEPQMI